MKGIAHFSIGLATASCFPEAVRQAAAGNPLPMLAGGLFGLLPDTLDFKAVRFFARHDAEIVPDPDQPDMQMVADGLAFAAQRAARSGRPVRIRLHTVRLGADRWQPYHIRFDPLHGIETRLAPVCNTSRRPLEPAVAGVADGFAPLDMPLVISYEAGVSVDILDGPMLAFTPLPDKRVRLDFLPWHRAWSHSFPVALAAGLLAGLAAGPLVGIIAALAYAAHATADQLGFLGAALLWPFRRRRFPGLQRFHAGEPLVNLAAVWGAALLLFWNLARFAQPAIPVSGPRLFFYAGLLPLGVLAVLRRK